MVRAEKIDSLTGLRFFAAMWVLLLHFREYRVDMIWEFPVIDKYIQNGQFGVDLFFVLSGFILSYVYHEQFSKKVSAAQWREFIIFRLARIYPVHFVTFAGVALIYAVSEIALGSVPHPERMSIGSVIATLSLTHAWSGYVTTPNLPAWSISAEFFAYLFCPFIILLINRVGVLKYLLPCVAVAALALFYDAETNTLVSKSLLRISCEFVIGVCAYYLRHEIRQLFEKLPGQRFIGLALVGLALICVYFMETGPLFPVMAVISAVLIVKLTDQNDALSTFVSRRWVIYGGQISYCLYMVHWPVRIVLRSAMELAGIIEQISPPLIILIYTAASLTAAVLLYHLVEEPGRKLGRKLAMPRRSVAA